MSEDRDEIEMDEEDGVVIAENEGEYSTEKIVVIDGTAYYMHPNGGANGAHNRQCGDGKWREYPCEPTRELTKQEAVAILLDWGHDPSDVAKLTKGL